MKKFIVFGRPRSGTTVVCHALFDHPEVLLFGELFHHRSEARSLEAARKSLGAGVRIKKSLREYGIRPCSKTESGYVYLDELFSRNVPFAAVGIKILCHHVSAGPNSDAWQYISDHPDIMVIHIVRENLLEIACSISRARNNIQWHADRPVKSKAFELSPADCEDLFQSYERMPDMCRRILETHDVLTLDYSRICDDFRDSIQRVFAFLGVINDVDISPKLTKIASLRPDQELLNYRELKAYFKDSRYSKYFVY